MDKVQQEWLGGLFGRLGGAIGDMTIAINGQTRTSQAELVKALNEIRDEVKQLRAAIETLSETEQAGLSGRQQASLTMTRALTKAATAGSDSGIE